MESAITSESSNGSDTINNVVHIRATLAPKFSLAFFQNSVPILLELALANESDQNLSSLKLTLSSTPAFIKTKAWHIDTLASGQKFHISERDLQLDGAMLGKLNEAEQVQVSISLIDKDESIANFEQTVELLPRN